MLPENMLIVSKTGVFSVVAVVAVVAVVTGSDDDGTVGNSSLPCCCPHENTVWPGGSELIVVGSSDAKPYHE
jgi:hypothetical protein